MRSGCAAEAESDFMSRRAPAKSWRSDGDGVTDRFPVFELPVPAGAQESSSCRGSKQLDASKSVPARLWSECGWRRRYAVDRDR
jgi:hypothetical protein